MDSRDDVDHEHRTLFIAFLEGYARGRVDPKDWNRLVVNHYLDRRLEEVRRECVRLRRENDGMTWSDEQQNRIDGWIRALSVADADSSPSPPVEEIQVLLRRAGALVAAVPGIPHDEIVAAIRPSLRILVDSGGTDAPLGHSRFGGLPDLPPGVDWPCAEGKRVQPLMFVAQIDLGRLEDPTGLLPDAGRLSFFFDILATPDGKDLEVSRVLYTEVANPIARRSPPDDLAAPAVLDARSVSSELVATIPAWLEASTAWPAATRDAYAELVDETLAGGAPYHRMLGWPWLVQGPMESELGGPPEDWVLLLQVDTDDTLGISWDDSGSLYFWIRKQDLAERRFDRVKTIIQSC